MDRLDPQDIVAQLDGWTGGDDFITKVFRFDGFAQAFGFMTQIALIAEKMDHHPDLRLYKYKNVRITLTTHSERRITRKDIKLAKIIDKIFDSVMAIK